MVPDKFNMVDMGGIDLIMMQGEEVPGLYMRLVESIAQCRYQCLYNWLFDGIVIPPTYVEMRIGDEDEVIINEGVTVTDDDAIHIYSLVPPAPEPEIIPLLAEENGEYTVPSGKDGFNPVTVDVPSYTPVIQSLSITENGTYTAPSGVDGYSPVAVEVPATPPVVQSLTATQNGIYNPPSGVDGFAPVTVNVSGGSNVLLKDVSIITASDILTEFEALLNASTGSAIDLQEAGTHVLQKFYRTSASNIIYTDLEESNTSATIYAVIRTKNNSGDYGGIVFCHNWSSGAAPMFFTRGNTWLTGIYGGDLSTGLSSNVFRVLALAVNGTSKIASYFIGGSKIRDNVSFTTSGRHASWGGGYNYQNVIQAAEAFDVLYGAVVLGVETEAEIIANCQAISSAYSNYIGT